MTDLKYNISLAYLEETAGNKVNLHITLKKEVIKHLLLQDGKQPPGIFNIIIKEEA